MSLQKIVEQINKLKPMAKEELDATPIETLTARRGRQQQAKDKLSLLTEEYTNEILKTAVFILVSGINRNVFTTIASENFGCFSADPEDFYKDLLEEMPTSLFNGKESVANLFNIFSRHLEDKALKMHVLSYPQMVYKHKYLKTIKNKLDFLEIAKQAINEQVGSEMAGIHAVRSVIDKAIVKGHTSKITPILLSSKDDNLLLDLASSLRRLSPNIFLVTAGKTTKVMKEQKGTVILKDVSEENVKGALTAIKSSLLK